MDFQLLLAFIWLLWCPIAKNRQHRVIFLMFLGHQILIVLWYLLLERFLTNWAKYSRGHPTQYLRSWIENYQGYVILVFLIKMNTPDSINIISRRSSWTLIDPNPHSHPMLFTKNITKWLKECHNLQRKQMSHMHSHINIKVCNLLKERPPDMKVLYINYYFLLSFELLALFK